MKRDRLFKTSLSLAILFFIWYLTTELQLVSPYVLPGPLRVFKSFLAMLRSGELVRDLQISLIRVLKGFFLASLLAFFLAMVRIIFPGPSGYYEGLIQFLKNVPPLSLISLLILWFGIGETTKVSLIVLTAFFPIYLNTVKGFLGCDEKLIELGQVYGYSRLDIFFKIRLPYALSDILVGMRIGLGYSWRAIISAEMIAASSGLGYMILFAQQMSRIDKVIVGIFLIASIGYLTDRIFALIIRKLLKGSDRLGWD